MGERYEITALRGARDGTIVETTTSRWRATSFESDWLDSGAEIFFGGVYDPKVVRVTKRPPRLGEVVDVEGGGAVLVERDGVGPSAQGLCGQVVLLPSLWAFLSGTPREVSPDIF